jgi:hypothetical protein
MLAHGFTIEMLDALVRDGLAMTEQREMRAGRQPIKVISCARMPSMQSPVRSRADQRGCRATFRRAMMRKVA